MNIQKGKVVLLKRRACRLLAGHDNRKMQVYLKLKGYVREVKTENQNSEMFALIRWTPAPFWYPHDVEWVRTSWLILAGDDIRKTPPGSDA